MSSSLSFAMPSSGATASPTAWPSQKTAFFRTSRSRFSSLATRSSIGDTSDESASVATTIASRATLPEACSASAPK